MSNLKFFINAEELAKEFKDFKVEVEQALEDGVKKLASMTHAKVAELAVQKLKSARKTYLDNLDFQEVAPGIWVVSLDTPALWIEEGRKSGDMTADLLKKGAKTAKDGSKYRAIPFDHGRPPSQMTGFAQNMVAKIKSELKKKGIPFKKIEYDSNGSPRIGKLHSMNIKSAKPTERASHDTLAGLTIYQSMDKRTGKVRRDILTFRTVSSKHKGSKWIHPGYDAQHFFEQALLWAEKIWDDEIVPEIMNKFGDTE